MQGSTFIRLDVHKATISVAVAMAAEAKLQFRHFDGGFEGGDIDMGILRRA